MENCCAKPIEPLAISSQLLDWLLQGPSWVEYRTRRDLLGEPEEESAVASARRRMLTEPAVRSLVEELQRWPGSVLNSHKSAGHLIHKLVFLADLGLQAQDPGMEEIVQAILAHQSPEGPFQVLMNIPVHFGGSGKDLWAWALCDAPLLSYVLLRFGLGGDPRVKTSVDYLVSLVRPNGWPCFCSPDLGKFRGPGRKEDPCPYPNLIMLRLLAALPGMNDSIASRIGTETILSLWSQSRERHPYMFFMGTDFRRLKAPLVWYDLLHVLDTLSRFPWVKLDPRYQEMLEVLRTKAGGDQRFTAESVWKAWDGWEFAQKKVPSRWITMLANKAAAAK